MTLYKEPLNILVVEDHLGDYILIEDYLTEEHPNLELTRAASFYEAREKLSPLQNLMLFYWIFPYPILPVRNRL
ncbi:hypothetical protein FHG64_03865 [Antarcticibacterium flavum]|uniref:Response regulator n=1 Tax=Antarcticibacterium flavum TaxID=2058175 RepID=A0A5B7X034_9FLAO|nr:hypothetical protein [Antarcticibacterium flavum]QCY68600.1 hypothetical protein FHG64_03865 [Antarcticibacterium flavum]